MTRNKSPASGGADGNRKNTKPQHTAAPPPTQPAAAPWVVLIDAKRRGMLFGRYASRAGAVAMVRLLRAQGLDARIEDPRS
jgi:hypothetical protein